MTGNSPARQPSATTQLELLARLANVVATQDTFETIWFQADQILADLIGHQLFTVLAYAGDGDLVTRLYSNQPEQYPVSHTKKMGPTPWGEQVLKRGQAYLGSNADDIRWAFPDHELIASMGLESTLNLPLRHAGRVVGTLNLLDEAGYYRPGHLTPGLIAATMLAPVMMRWLETAAPAESG